MAESRKAYKTLTGSLVERWGRPVGTTAIRNGNYTRTIPHIHWPGKVENATTVTFPLPACHHKTWRCKFSSVTGLSPKLMIQELTSKSIPLLRTRMAGLATARAPGSRQAVRIQAKPSSALVDEALHVQAAGLQPGQRVTLAAKVEDSGCFLSHAHYAANNRGELDLNVASSNGGSYQGDIIENILQLNLACCACNGSNLCEIALIPDKTSRKFIHKRYLGFGLSSTWVDGWSAR